MLSSEPMLFCVHSSVSVTDQVCFVFLLLLLRHVGSQAFCYFRYSFKQSFIPTQTVELRQEGVWGSGCLDPHFLDLGTSWRCVVSFTPLALYPRGKSRRQSLGRRLGGPQPAYTTWRKERSSPYRDLNSNPSFGHPVASHYTASTISAPLYPHETNVKNIVLLILILMFPDRSREEKIFNWV
jgi:hypothetical protein